MSWISVCIVKARVAYDLPRYLGINQFISLPEKRRRYLGEAARYTAKHRCTIFEPVQPVFSGTPFDSTNTCKQQL